MRGATDVPADKLAGETRFGEPASSSNGWLGGPPTENVDANVKMDTQMDDEEAAAQEASQDVSMGFLRCLDQSADDVASEMILMAL